MLSWINHQLRPWRNHGVRSPGDLDCVLQRISAYLFRVENGKIYCDYKTGSRSDFDLRARQYHEFFKCIALKRHLPAMIFALDVDDEAVESVDRPLFSFQRQIGEKNILLPDMEILTDPIYGERWGLPDNILFEEKEDRACFVGSTTGGGHITLETLRHGGFPRLNSARYFRDMQQVTFVLSSIVQCAADAEAALRLEGHGSGWVSWQEQLKNKFVISMDGNGASCSRVAVTLASNSVLCKYQSSNELFYFNGLVDGHNFLKIEHDDDILRIINQEIIKPNLYFSVARNGYIFANEHLSMDALERYTGDLIVRYAELA